MKKYLILLVFVAFLFTGCGSIKIDGKYKWRPYKNNNYIYAYYNFVDDESCVFALALSETYTENSQTCKYEISKNGDHYDIKITPDNGGNEYTIEYYKSDDYIIDIRMKDMEDIWEKEYGVLIDNKQYGLFEKVEEK